MNNSKETLLSIVTGSSLSDEQKLTWQGFLENLDEELVVPLVETIQGDENMLQLLTKNIEDKIQALSSDNPAEWERVKQEEKGVLEKIDE